MNAALSAPRFTSSERDALVILGFLHLEQSRPDEAATLLRPLLRDRPDDGEAERCLALAELLAGRPENAARLAAHAYPHAPDRLRTAVGLVYAKALWVSGDEAGAREVLAKILTRKENRE
jgi:predicted Zn-dependent protease